MQLGEKQKRVSRDSVVKAPSTVKLVRAILQDEEGGKQIERAEKNVTAEGFDSVLAQEEYVMDPKVGKSNENGRWEFKVR